MNSSDSAVPLLCCAFQVQRSACRRNADVQPYRWSTVIGPVCRCVQHHSHHPITLRQDDEDEDGDEPWGGGDGDDGDEGDDYDEDDEGDDGDDPYGDPIPPLHGAPQPYNGYPGPPVAYGPYPYAQPYNNPAYYGPG